MRFCGVDVAGRRGSNLCVLEEHDAGVLEATLYKPGEVKQIATAVLALDEVVVAVDAPQAPRRDLLATGSVLREELRLPPGRHERARVCDALLVRKRLWLYSVPAREEDAPPWMQRGFEFFRLLGARLPLYRPEDGSAGEGPVPADAARDARLVETYPDAAFCALLGRRPPPKTTPAGIAQRIRALEECGVAEADLWHRTMDEIDACLAALTAWRFARGRASWIGHPEEGVMVLPVVRLEETYAIDGPEPERKDLPLA